MKRFLLLSCLLLPLLGLQLLGRPPLAHAAETYHLVRIVVTGTQRCPQEDLVRATGLALNSDVTMEDLQAAAARMGNSGMFSTIQFTFKPAAGVHGVEADFAVKDAAAFLPAVFENFIWLSDEELQRALHQALPLFSGVLPLSGTMPDDVSDALKKLLAAKGLPSGVSYMLFTDLGRAPSAYQYKVENSGLKIEDIHVSGANHIAPDALAASLAAARGQEYLRSTAQRMLERSLEPVYGEHGFLTFKLIDFKPVLNAGGGVVLEVTVSEGEQYRLAGFSWSGNTVVSSDQLSKLITLKMGSPVNLEQLRHDLSDVRKVFRKYGRERAMITPVPTLAADTVTYNFSVQEGDVYRMGRLEIEGFDFATTRKLTESWKLAPGAPYDSTYLQQFLLGTLSLAHGRQHEWLVLEEPDEALKVVNVRLRLKAQ